MALRCLKPYSTHAREAAVNGTEKPSGRRTNSHLRTVNALEIACMRPPPGTAPGQSLSPGACGGNPRVRRDGARQTSAAGGAPRHPQPESRRLVEVLQELTALLGIERAPVDLVVAAGAQLRIAHLGASPARALP